ncbi:MAG: site-2 protease family protein [Deltaproteobacteria bacterium]|nr:site-2 protease family protein [Deltaproteobacteria bacterium]
MGTSRSATAEPRLDERERTRSLWSPQVGRIAGIPIRIHATFLLLLAWIGAIHWFAGEGVAAAVEAVVLMCLVFASVVVHELSHALVGRRFGVRTRDILLLPIGGIASMDRMPEKPMQELLVALAGPLTNVVIAGVLFGVVALSGGSTSIEALGLVHGGLLAQLAWINVSLAVFNLLPAFPMDGGRVFRALLSTMMPRERATRVAARVGQVLAVVFGLVGLAVNPVLVFIAIFIWIGAAEEARQSEVSTALAGVPASRAMMHDFRMLSPTSTLGQAAALVLDGWQRDFPVVDAGGVRGLLTRSSLIRALAHEAPGNSVEPVMDHDLVTASPTEPLQDVLVRMREKQAPAALVVVAGALVGMITPENVLDLLEISEARHA